MRAVVIERPGEAVFREVDPPIAGPDDVLVRSRRAGVCRTDLEVLAGDLDPRWVQYPCIPWHEWSGVVEHVGAAVTGFSPGDRVVCEGMIPGERCRRCRAGETNVSENYDQLGFTRAGGYGELVVAPQRVVHRLLIGSVGYTKAVWRRMVGLTREGLVELDPIVTHRFSASRFRDAFDLLEPREGTVAKIVLEHEV